jgi:hypothetical protein
VKDLLFRCGRECGVTPVALHDLAFECDLPWFTSLTPEEERQYLRAFKPEGYVYSVFGGVVRNIQQFDRYRVLLTVRDPRDILVSQFYSIRYSHAPPGGGDRKSEFQRLREIALSQDIDTYVLEHAEKLRATFLDYIDCLFPLPDNVRVLRYEDMVESFEVWLDALLSHCELGITSTLRSELIEESALTKRRKEDPSKHLRKGKAGDHAEKLSPRTIAALDRMFCDILKAFGYA